MAASSIMESLFQRTLEDLIKGLRLQPPGDPSFLAKALDEIRREVKSTDAQTKATALHKLAYLHAVHGVDMSWAAFHALEAASAPRFAHKKIGYVAASLSLPAAPDLLLLATNLLRKDLVSPNPFDASLALELLSVAANSDLARDLTPDLFTLLSSSKVLVRKKAIAVLLKVFGLYPDAVRVCFKRLVENLESSDQPAVSATVGVFCELVAKDPGSYLPLAPEFYRVLVDSKNNWVLIKVVKIFGKLVPLEPRLGKRVLEPICEHMTKTGAKSLMFECVRMIVTSLSEYESAVKLAVLKIRELLLDDDPNLKYLGLQALSILGSKHLWAVLENKEVVIKSLSDVDPNIKLESLHLVMIMVSEDNAVEISRVLVNYALKSEPDFCNEIIGCILSTCSKKIYEIIVDFDWYVSLLGEISRIPHCRKGEEIENQLIDIGMRVRDVRPELVHVGRDLLIDPALLGNPLLHRVLSAAAWVSGEYVEFSKNPFELMEALLQPRASLLPPFIRAIYIQSAFKVLIFCLHSYLSQREISASTSSPPENLVLGASDSVFERECQEGFDLVCETPADSVHDEGFNPRVSNQSHEDLSVENGGDKLVTHEQPSNSFLAEEVSFSLESIVSLLNLMELALGPLLESHEVEIQERVRNVLGLIELIKQDLPGFQRERGFEKQELKASQIINLTHDALTSELGPVSMNAQGRVPVPDGLILKENLSDLDTICGDLQLPSSCSFSIGFCSSDERVCVSQSKEESEPYTESTSLLAEHRKRHGLYYLPAEKNDIISNDYPPANDPKLLDDLSDDAKNLVKLTEQSLVRKKKPNRAKPRPVVVKLDEGDMVTIAAKMPSPKDDMLSGAAREILVGNEAETVSSRINTAEKSSSKRRGKEKLIVDLPSESNESLDDAEKPGLENASSKNKHSTHGKDRRHKMDGKDSEKREHGRKAKQKSSHRHRHKTQQGTDGLVSVGPQAAVIPDFLL